MNSDALAVALVIAAVLAVLIAVVIQLVMRGWRRRAARQAEMIGALPEVPEQVGAAIVAPTPGTYVGCTLAPSWHDRVAVGDLGYRTKAVLTRYPEGVLVQRSAASPIWIPQESITAIGTERRRSGKTLTHGGILAVRWRLPSGTEINTGFRANDNAQHKQWLAEDRAVRPGDGAQRSDEEERRV